MASQLKRKLSTKKAQIAVIGLGYVGLPIAVNFAKKGYRVSGLDKDVDRVARVNAKQSYILDVADKDLSRVVKNKKMQATTDFKSLKDMDVIIICVPTPLRKKYTPDISYMLGAIKETRKYMKKDTLIVLESTTYPGTTEELIYPELKKGGRKVDRDFFLSFSPERIDPGNKSYDVTNIPKLVGGLTQKSGELTKYLYEKIVKRVHLVSSTKAAEMTKLHENSFRIINIAWINDVAKMCHKLDIDIWEVIEAANTKPFGFMAFYPGLGVGGHCIPDDPMYLFWKAKHHGYSSKFLKLSADTNSSMPLYACERLREILKSKKKALSKSKVLILGVTYKKDVKDLRKSPALKLIEILQQKRCEVYYSDPIIPFLEIGDIHLKSVKLTPAALKKYDCVVLAVDHTKFKYSSILKNSKLIYDIRNVYSGVKDKKVRKF